jgi:hypothetical protein
VWAWWVDGGGAVAEVVEERKVVVVSSEVAGDMAVCFVIHSHQEWYVK